MKVVVTGAAGQLGSLVLERLVAHPGIEQILALDLVPPRIPGSNIEYRMVDLKDPGVERHLEGADALVHLAFVVARPMHPDLMRAVNVEGSRRLFEAAARHAVRKVVYASSVAAYGLVSGHPVPLVETSARRRTPYLAYADHKWEVEDFLDAFEREHPETRVVRLRPGLLLGRRIPHVKESLLRRRILPVIRGAARPPIVWDEDVADAAMIALTLSGARGAYNLVAADPVAPERLVELAGFRGVPVPRGVVAVAQGVTRAFAKATQRTGAADWASAAQAEQVVSSERALRELEWRPRYPTATDVAVAFGREARGPIDRRLSLFSRLVRWVPMPSMVPFLDARPARTLRIHLDVTGPSGADFSMSVDRKGVKLTHGIARPVDSVVRLSPETLLAMLEKERRGEALLAARQLEVFGDSAGGPVLCRICDAIVASTREPSVRGRAARTLSGWLHRGSAA